MDRICHECSGSGQCDACDGYGSLLATSGSESEYDGINCPVCSGTAQCVECCGIGEIGTEDTDNTESTDTDEDAAPAFRGMRQ
ncbi:hypothetical protein [Pseudonocardia sp. GCM10023141]|uniref:hypothetical protein n=1 Tax=Pseudonocardia sp. GCM10023141 TaxID=3252653 RepID=UPI003615571D